MFHVWLNGPQDFRAVESAGLLGVHNQPGMAPGNYKWLPAEEFLYPARMTFDYNGRAIHWGAKGEERQLEDVLSDAGDPS